MPKKTIKLIIECPVERKRELEEILNASMITGDERHITHELVTADDEGRDPIFKYRFGYLEIEQNQVEIKII